MNDSSASQAETPVELARSLFLREDNYYGCAESTLVALQQLYDLPDATDSAAAMVLNGGVAYSGGVCGAISGAAMAVGRLAASRIPDHQQAKRVARSLIQRLATEFVAEFGGGNCSQLIEYDISTASGHDEFIASGVWRSTCMRQIEFSVSRLGALADEKAWALAIAELDASPES